LQILSKFGHSPTIGADGTNYWCVSHQLLISSSATMPHT
jgi:hypothetical protein